MLWTYIISDLNGAEIDGTFYDKELQKTNQKERRIEKVNKTIEKGDKSYVKWERCNNLLSILIDKKRYSMNG